jgi:hypothetical protein
MAHALKQGDVMYSSWGYNQTNITFYRVTRATATTVMLERLRNRLVERMDVMDLVAPSDESNGDVGRRKVKRYDDEDYVEINSYKCAFPWDGRPKAKTAPGYGH